MWVKIGNNFFNGADQPIMAIFDEDEKDYIKSMGPGENRFCSYPENSDPDKIERWMEDDGDEKLD